ncbi:MAG: FHA domain-containing protein [Candidatus Binataceae bacterium]
MAEGAKGTIKQPRRVAIGGAAGARELPLVKRKTTIGSAIGNYFVLDEKTVSRRHAVIRRRLRGYDLIDLESTNGTYVNGKRVTNPIRLKRGDEIGFGNARFAFMAGAGARGPGLRIAVPLMLLLFLIAFSVTRRWIQREAREALGESPAPRASIAPAAAGTTLAAAEISATSIATPSGPQPEWLKRLNAYRAMAKVAPVVEDSTLSAGDSAHVKYLVENLGPSLRAGGNPGIDSHLESKDKPGYSAVGARAGESSDVDFIAFAGTKIKDPAGWALVDWISGAFHRLPLLNPRLRRVGFNQVCDRGLCVAALDAQSGVESSAAGTAYATPIEFPADHTSIDLRTFTDEWPDPLSACAGYKAPTGLPITLATGYWIHTSLDAYSFERISTDGAATKLDACGFDSSTYTNLDPATQKTAREVLLGQGTVVVIPLAPLTAGATYRVSITASGTQYRWTFSIAKGAK